MRPRTRYKPRSPDAVPPRLIVECPEASASGASADHATIESQQR